MALPLSESVNFYQLKLYLERLIIPITSAMILLERISGNSELCSTYAAQ